MYTTIIPVTTLAARLDAPDWPSSNWLIVDCRFDLAQPAAGETAYRAGHIPGAVYAHLDRDLSSPITPVTGRHPLPDPERLAATLSAWGVSAETQVVAYDADNGMYASRLWWLLRWVGHRAVAVLEVNRNYSESPASCHTPRSGRKLAGGRGPSAVRPANRWHTAAR